MSTALKYRLDVERCEQQARLALAIGGVAAIAVDLIDPDSGSIEQIVRVRPPAATDTTLRSKTDTADVDVDYLISPPRLTSFLGEAIQNPEPIEQTLEIATEGQLSAAARQVVQQLLGVSHLLACRIDGHAPGLLVFALQRSITAPEAAIVAGFARAMAVAFDSMDDQAPHTSSEDALLTGILAVADAARLDASERLDGLLTAIAERIRTTLDVDSILLAVPQEKSWQLGVALSDDGRRLHPAWESGAGDVAGGIARWVYRTGQFALAADVRTDERASTEHDGPGPEAVMVVPLQARGTTIGVLRAGSTAVGRFGGADLEALAGLGKQTTIVVENGQLYLKTRGQNERLALFARVVATSPDAIVLADLDEHIHHCNAATARLFGYSEVDLVGRRVSTLLGVASLAALRLEEPSGSGESDREIRLPRKDGSTFSAEIHVSLVHDDESRAIGSATIVRDLTGRKQLEQQLLQSEKLRSVGVMASGVAHQMNNTLASVVGQADLVLNTTKDPETQARMTSIIQAAEDGAAAVRRIRDFARESAPENFDPLDLAAIARDVLEATAVRWRDQAQREGRAIDATLTVRGSSWVPGSHSELREAVTNLVLNAVDALPEGGHISMRVEEEENKVALYVQDDGTGMPMEVAQRAFDPFFTTKPFGSGTGLGLALTRGIVQRHHGSIDVRSEPGQGTTFEIRLPRAEPAVEAPAEPASSPPSAIRILVVEDEPILCEQLRAILSIDRHDVRVCGGGPEGLAALSKEDFDLVITDLGMPDVDGWEIARAAKARRADTRVALVTGWAGEVADRGDLAERGVDTVISKPYRIQTIRDAVAEATSR
jgi:two-component system cell cycle sensor histidine kinase/response regulator CckA